MINRRMIAVLASVLVGGPLSAEWEMLDNFEEGDASNWMVSMGLNQNSTNPPALSVLDDPAGKGQGKVLRVFPGELTEGTSLTGIFALPLPEALKILDKSPAENNTSTLYFKMMGPLEGNAACYFGLLSDEFLEVDISEWSFGRFSVQCRLAGGTFTYRGESGYAGFDTSMASPANGTAMANTYYEFWFVIDRTTETYDGYVRGGQWATRAKVWEGAPYRIKPGAAPLDTIILATSYSASEKGAPYFDDFYIDTSGVANLEAPAGAVDPDPDPVTDAEFTNISTRGLVLTEGGIMIGGFVVRGVEGAETGTVLIRAIGPGLGALGVGGTLEDPLLEIYNQASPPELVYSNDDWGTGANSDATAIEAARQAVGGFPIADGSKDACLLLALPPGGYTAQVSGVGGTTGVAIIEVYAVD